MKSRGRCSAVSSSIITIYIPIMVIFESAGSDVVFIVSIFEGGVAGTEYDIPVILIVSTLSAAAIATVFVMSNGADVLTTPVPTFIRPSVRTRRWTQFELAGQEGWEVLFILNFFIF
jgi:hypothetical protein